MSDKNLSNSRTFQPQSVDSSNKTTLRRLEHLPNRTKTSHISPFAPFLELPPSTHNPTNQSISTPIIFLVPSTITTHSSFSVNLIPARHHDPSLSESTIYHDEPFFQENPSLFKLQDLPCSCSSGSNQSLSSFSLTPSLDLSLYDTSRNDDEEDNEENEEEDEYDEEYDEENEELDETDFYDEPTFRLPPSAVSLMDKDSPTSPKVVVFSFRKTSTKSEK